IELEQDITPPSNYIEIDHHGKNDHKPSSLEQVADILGLELSRKQQLIAANDSRYIDGMKKLCATNKEIEMIRKEDRAAQGISEFDEKLGIASVENSKSHIIYSITSHFSATSDEAHKKYDKYVLYNYSKIVFYGYKKEKILEFLESQNISKNSFYYGGGDFGFIGIKDNILDKNQIENLIKELEEKEETIYSYHTFMLPFIIKGDEKEIINGWKPKTYPLEYNEEAYFHKFFKDSFFSKNTKYYEKDEFENQEYIVTKSKKYLLNLQKTTLRIFDTGIGILSLHLENKSYRDSKSILEINDYGRRIYPEYLDYENAKSGLVPVSVEFDGETEKFEYDLAKKKNKPTVSKIIDKFIPTSLIEPAVDDRMFVISFYNNAVLVNQVAQNYMCNDTWYEYVFVDGNGKTVQDEKMHKELIKDASYTRWKNYGTMYGVSKYSFVCLANSNFPLPHIQTMYQSMFSLLLMVRATLLKFSDEVSDIANHIDNTNTARKVEDLYKRYIKFVNNFYFREITAKDQGLELYEKGMAILNIQRDIKDLDSEIEELHKFVEMQQRKEVEKEAEKTNKKLENISLWGGVLLGVSVLTGFFGMNVNSGNFSGWLVYPLVFGALYLGYTKYIKENHE
ncbi:MAG: hypothetical protein IE909_12690, partial [Campylobacterales bacterium]|nr:hypothetical protein [Campylobacterales bacterium]